MLLYMLIGARNFALEKRYAVDIESGLNFSFFSIMPQIAPRRSGNVPCCFMTSEDADLNVRSPVQTL